MAQGAAGACAGDLAYRGDLAMRPRPTPVLQLQRIVYYMHAAHACVSPRPTNMLCMKV